MKATNPKDSIGSTKLPLHLWPTTATAMGCVGMLEGMAKYGRTNWREAGVRASIYVDACKRHLDAWFEGEQVAPDSGVPHLANALACLAIIVDAEAAGKLVDDRAYRGAGYRRLVEQLTPHVERLKALHADKNPRHYTIADTAAPVEQPDALPGLHVTESAPLPIIERRAARPADARLMIEAAHMLGRMAAPGELVMPDEVAALATQLLDSAGAA